MFIYLVTFTDFHVFPIRPIGPIQVNQVCESEHILLSIHHPSTTLLLFSVADYVVSQHLGSNLF